MLGQLHSPLIPVSTVSIPERGGVGGGDTQACWSKMRANYKTIPIKSNGVLCWLVRLWLLSNQDCKGGCWPEVCSAEQVLVSWWALTKFCVADIGNFGKCTQTLAQLNTPQVWTCKQSIVNNVFAVSVDANITISRYKQWSWSCACHSSLSANIPYIDQC